MIIDWIDRRGCGAVPDGAPGGSLIQCSAVILTADLNAEEEDEAFSIFEAANLKAIRPGHGGAPHFGPRMTFAGFYHEHAKVIDFVFVRGAGEITVGSTAVMVDDVGCYRSTRPVMAAATGGQDPVNVDVETSEVEIEPPAASDHRPVLADIVIHFRRKGASTSGG